ncbi:hypothetical protein [Luteibacter sp.]|uniref:hypothetical protein n=1 Tax=Luteibacter sp. TaxID=1886636 RepID=UPI003F820C10
MDSAYTIDVDVELIPGRGYSASYIIVDTDGAVVRRRQLARRFASYSEAMGCALDIAKGSLASLPTATSTSTQSDEGDFGTPASLSVGLGGLLQGGNATGLDHPA